MRKSNWFTLLAGIVFVSACQATDVSAQTYGVDYISFEGRGVVLDNPTSAGCENIGVSYGSVFTVIYRWTANPSVIADSLTIVGNGHSTSRMLATQSPFSLNGTSQHTWTYINRHSDFNGGILPGSSTMTILAGNNTAVSLATGNIKIVNAQIPNFLANSNCSISNFHAALVSIPN